MIEGCVIAWYRFRAVLSITSDAAVEAYAGWGGYGAAKAALEQACNVLAAEEVAIRVWRVDPGDLRTQMHQDAFPGEDISDRPLPESVAPAFRRLISERMPSGRYRAADLMPATDPAATDPAATDPAATDPAATDPAASVPTVTDPAVTDPEAGDRAGAAPGAELVLGVPGRS